MSSHRHPHHAFFLFWVFKDIFPSHFATTLPCAFRFAHFLMLFVFLDTFKIGLGSKVTTHYTEVRVLCAYIKRNRWKE
jgi:hypothetical protein